MSTAISDVLAYVDASALAKLLKSESETSAIAAALTEWDEAIVSSILLEPELRRVAVRYALPQSDVDVLLDAVTLIEMDPDIRQRTGALAPTRLRALDAVHLATALELGAGLGVMFVYDERLTEAALLAGVPVSAPRPRP